MDTNSYEARLDELLAEMRAHPQPFYFGYLQSIHAIPRGSWQCKEIMNRAVEQVFQERERRSATAAPVPSVPSSTDK